MSRKNKLEVQSSSHIHTDKQENIYQEDFQTEVLCGTIM